MTSLSERPVACLFYMQDCWETLDRDFLMASTIRDGPLRSTTVGATCQAILFRVAGKRVAIFFNADKCAAIAAESSLAFVPQDVPRFRLAAARPLSDKVKDGDTLMPGCIACVDGIVTIDEEGNSSTRTAWNPWVLQLGKEEDLAKAGLSNVKNGFVVSTTQKAPLSGIKAILEDTKRTDFTDQSDRSAADALCVTTDLPDILNVMSHPAQPIVLVGIHSEDSDKGRCDALAAAYKTFVRIVSKLL